MVKLTWDNDGQRLYETGVDRAILFPRSMTNGQYEKGVAWNGLTKVAEAPDGGDTTEKYANNNTYLQLVARERFKGTISAFTYPDEWAECDGSASPKNGSIFIKGVRVTGQTRKPFGLVYRTLVGNDTAGTDFGYQLHFVYAATASVSSRDYETVNDSPDAIEFSWSFSTTPVQIPGMRPSAYIVIDSTKVANKQGLANLEEILEGTAQTNPRLPLPEELFTLLGSRAG